MSNDKTVLITGAGSGIGAATAKRFAGDGYSVVLAGRTQSKLERVAADIAGEALVHPADVAKPDDVAALVEASAEKFGRLDVVVNCAGAVTAEPIDDMSFDDWNQQLAVNAGGVFLTIQAALPHLLEVGGCVVNVSSVSGLGGDWGMFAYNAAKGAVSNLTRALALDLGGRGVRVNAVAPSLTDTEMASDIIENDELLQQFARRMPLGRPAQPDEVASVIAFLAGEDARFVNGVVLPVDGGLSASNGQPRFG